MRSNRLIALAQWADVCHALVIVVVVDGIHSLLSVSRTRFRGMEILLPVSQVVSVVVAVVGVGFALPRAMREFSWTAREREHIERDLRWAAAFTDGRLAQTYADSAIHRAYWLEAKKRYTDDSQLGSSLVVMVLCSCVSALVAIPLLSATVPGVLVIRFAALAATIIAGIRFLHRMERAHTVFTSRKLFQVLRGPDGLADVPRRRLSLCALVQSNISTEPDALLWRILTRAWELEHADRRTFLPPPVKSAELVGHMWSLDVKYVNAAIAEIRLG